MADREDLKCLHCQTICRHLGERRMQEGSHWLGPMLARHVTFDLYMCPQCGFLQMFVPLESLEAVNETGSYEWTEEEMEAAGSAPQRDQL